MDPVRVDIRRLDKPARNREDEYLAEATSEGVKTTGRYIVYPICLQLLKKGVLSGRAVHFYRDDKLIMTLRSIEDGAKTRLTETDKGFVRIKHKDSE